MPPRAKVPPTASRVCAGVRATACSMVAGLTVQLRMLNRPCLASSSPRRSCLVLVSLCLAVAACGSDSPAPVTPAAPTPTTSAVQVRATGDASGTLEAGQTRQLVATATQSTGTTSDVTQQATWQSSAPAVATVSATGLVTAVAQGDAEISATYQSVRGTMGVGVRPVPCPVSLSPATATFGPFGGAGSVQVLVGAASCRWSARSDAPWLPFAFEPDGPGQRDLQLHGARQQHDRASHRQHRRHDRPPARPRCTRSRSIARRGAAT